MRSLALRKGLAALGTILATLVSLALPAGTLAVPAAKDSNITAGFAHTCADSDRGTFCWGRNNRLQLTNPVESPTVDPFSRASHGSIGDNETPAGLIAYPTTKSIVAGDFYTCALFEARNVQCSGRNDVGQLGNATASYEGVDVPVSLGTAANQIAAGDEHTCALLDGGSVRCWGSHAAGGTLLGDDSVNNPADAVDLGAGRRALAIDAGIANTCAILDDASLRCWGRGYAPRDIDLGGAKVEVVSAAAEGGGCAILDSGQLRCGITRVTQTTVNIGAGRKATAVSGNESHLCAILDDGAVKCWGRSGPELGYPGRAPTADFALGVDPGKVDLGVGRTAKEIATGDDHTCAILDNDAILCWGDGRDGRLGYANLDNIGDDETPGSINSRVRVDRPVPDRVNDISVYIDFESPAGIKRGEEQLVRVTVKNEGQTTVTLRDISLALPAAFRRSFASSGVVVDAPACSTPPYGQLECPQTHRWTGLAPIPPGQSQALALAFPWSPRQNRSPVVAEALGQLYDVDGGLRSNGDYKNLVFPNIRLTSATRQGSKVVVRGRVLSLGIPSGDREACADLRSEVQLLKGNTPLSYRTTRAGTYRAGKYEAGRPCRFSVSFKAKGLARVRRLRTRAETSSVVFLRDGGPREIQSVTSKAIEVVTKRPKAKR